MTQLKVHIVDDDHAVRQSLGLLLETEGLAVDAHESGESFLSTYDHRVQGCLILDMRMPGMSGLEVQAELSRRGASLPVIFLSAFGDVPTTVEAMKAGAEDFLTKPPDAGILIGKVKALLDKSRIARETAVEKADLQARLDALTAREKEILGKAIAGRSSKEIARQLGLSQRTVENHRLRINKKLRTGNLLEFFHRAARCGIDIHEA